MRNAKTRTTDQDTIPTKLVSDRCIFTVGGPKPWFTLASAWAFLFKKDTATLG